MLPLLRCSSIVLAAICLIVASVPASANGEVAYQKAKASFGAGDSKTAAKWLQRAVSQGHSAARLPLAAMYRDGVGVRQNLKMAYKLFKISAEEGYPSAQYGLAELYRLGEGVDRDWVKSMQWYKRAALQADAAAQNSLGVVYEYGRGVRSNYALARMWYNIAGINGSKRGERNKERVVRKMKPHEVEMSMKLSTVCLASNYKDCG